MKVKEGMKATVVDTDRKYGIREFEYDQMIGKEFTVGLINHEERDSFQLKEDSIGFFMKEWMVEPVVKKTAPKKPEPISWIFRDTGIDFLQLCLDALDDGKSTFRSY